MEFINLEISPARRNFKENLGQANQFLITIEVGLDAVRQGRADASSPSWTSWDPRDPRRSADRSSGFASLAALALLIDGLDAYVSDITSKPTLLQDQATAKILARQSDSTKRFEALADLCGVNNNAPWALAQVARKWRHRLLHRTSTGKPTVAARDTLIANKERVRSEYAGLDVEAFLARFDEGSAPRFKETTTMIRGSHRLIEQMDTILVGNLDLEKFAREAVDAYLIADEKLLLSKRIDNIWSKDERRRHRTLRNVLMNTGLSTRQQAVDGWTDATELFKELVGESPTSVKRRLS
ncbi:MAG TPA: hypothetical protein VGO13_05240 [Solirubrobacterales bacterium]|jgi:hypothetical protein|nr:hypothetical protein [Solirubrobacterales bacterium]